MKKFNIINSFATKRQEDVSRECEQISGQQGRMVGIRIYRLINFIMKNIELDLPTRDEENNPLSDGYYD